MTGNLVAGTIALVDLAVSRGASDSARARWLAAWPLLAGFVVGCLIGAAGAVAFSDRAALTPALLACILFAVVVSTHSASDSRIRTVEQPQKEGQS